MPPKPDRFLCNFLIDRELEEALQTLKARDGIPLGEQIRRALHMWFQSQGVKLAGPAQRSRPPRRRRSAR